ncbi:MAG: hypothetical protein COB02_17375 [Candidatus Cloacimonadota bacterium]|nr:MAG: hypothetical protein COB02_17375 [Candidatus Cloacimonadota bacterium]
MKDEKLEKLFQNISTNLDTNKVLTEAIIEKIHPKISTLKVLFTFSLGFIFTMICSQLFFYLCYLFLPSDFINLSNVFREPKFFNFRAILVLLENTLEIMAFISFLFSFIVCISFPEFLSPIQKD